MFAALSVPSFRRYVGGRPLSLIGTWAETVAGHGETAATQITALLYVGYNFAAALISVSAAWRGDRNNPVQRLAVGSVLFAAGYVWLTDGGEPLLLLPGFPPYRTRRRLRRDRRERGRVPSLRWRVVTEGRSRSRR